MINQTNKVHNMNIKLSIYGVIMQKWDAIFIYSHI